MGFGSGSRGCSGFMDYWRYKRRTGREIPTELKLFSRQAGFECGQKVPGRKTRRHSLQQIVMYCADSEVDDVKSASECQILSPHLF